MLEVPSPQHHPFDLLLELEQQFRKRTSSTQTLEEHSNRTTARLALRLGSWYLLFSMDEVVEIIPVPRITWVPGVKPWLMGVANLRGTVVSVVDLQRFLINKITAQTPNSQLVVVRAEEWKYGLLIDEVIGMRHFSAHNRQSRATEIEPKVQSYLTDSFQHEDKVWLELDIQHLVTDRQFLEAAI